jgi:hypothetical protein
MTTTTTTTPTSTTTTLIKLNTIIPTKKWVRPLYSTYADNIIISKALPLWRNVDAIRSTKSYYLDDDDDEEDDYYVNIQVDDIYDYALCVYYDRMMIMTMLWLL